jgi:hypothetical protein
MKRFSHLSFRWSLAALMLVLMLALPWAALASSVDVAVVDVTAPTGSVTLAPGGNGPITIDMTVTGKQDGTATFKVYRDWTLSEGSFTGGNPQTFTVPPRAAQDPATTFSTSGTVSVAAGQSSDTFTLAVSAFEITNSNPTGAKLSDGADSNYQVTVSPPADTTPPVISKSISGTKGNNDWYTTDVSVDWTVSDPESAVTIDEGCVDTTINYDTTGVTLTCVAHSAGGSSSDSVTIKRDATAPIISASVSPARPASGWWNIASGAPTVSFTCSDATSGLAGSCPADYTFGEGENQSHSQTIYDNAGNSASAGVSDVDVDLTAPTITWNGGPAAGGSYYFGFVPAAPTCTASDLLSGPNGCTVTGYSAAVGSHTMTATAYDVAGNSKTEMRSYEVKAWEMYGFYQPVDMTPDGQPTVWNTVKGGSTVPLKFEVFAGSLEFTDPSVIVQPLQASKVSCTTGSEDAIEGLAAAGNTVLRYDFTDGQFIYNWKTPKSPGTCYKVTVSSMSGSSLTASFKLK